MEKRGGKGVNLHPHALQRVLGPSGPFLHSGESEVPQSVHMYSPFIRFFLSTSVVFLGG